MPQLQEGLGYESLNPRAYPKDNILNPNIEKDAGAIENLLMGLFCPCALTIGISFIAGRPRKLPAKKSLRHLINISSCTYLINMTSVHQRDPISKRESFFLVVGHEDARKTSAALPRPELAS